MKERLDIFARKIKEFFSDKKRRSVFIWISSVALAVILIFTVCAVYVGDYYHADSEAIAAFADGSGVTVHTIDKDTTAFIPDGARAGFIFYPGGKVEAESYRPLMLALAERGILAVLTEMPFNLAVLDVNAADGVREAFPEVESWYIGGHSLGGSMAASYLAKNADSFDGLVLLGSYSTADLSSFDVEILSIYGSADGVMNREKYEKYKPNIATNLSEIVIDGGNHAYYGMYGEQSGDGAASISPAEQITLTAEYISEMIFN